MKKPEILAPAGSYEAFVAAIQAGADAVYIGGSRFGARAYANNFNEEEVISAVHYAHLYGRKVYMTINTLFKEQEINELYDYLFPYYEAGLDGVIVQDMGVFTYIREHFPNISLHGSTQMTVTNVYGAKLLADYGAQRVVPARELSLFEIKEIKEKTGLEIEVFVQGALCYSYSGQCLLSSMIGGRSGNRGRCAQPCRLPYDVFADDKCINNKEKYVLSSKDMCAVSMVSQLIEAGVDSFKIEGRMKSKEYVAQAVKTYREAVDGYFNNISVVNINKENINNLREIYNRGGFTNGYLNTHNGVDMMSMMRPNHEGVCVGKVEKIVSGKITFKAKEDIHLKDILEIRGSINIELTSNVEASVGSDVSLNAKSLNAIKVGMPIYRTRNNSLLSELSDKYNGNQMKENINIILKLYKGNSAIIEIGYNNICVFVEGDMVLEATNKPLSKEDIISKVSKLGDTRYIINDINVLMDENIFLPIKAINQLRRDGIEALEQSITNSYQRKIEHIKPSCIENNLTINSNNKKLVSVMVSNENLLDIVLSYKEVENIYLDEVFFNNKSLLDNVEKIKSANKKIYIVLPHIFRKQASNKEWLDIIKVSDGVVIRNIDELGYIYENNITTNIILDYSMYSYNSKAIEFYNQLLDNPIITLPVEQNKEELKNICNSNSELIVYGYNNVMYSAQCVNKNTLKCDKQEKYIILKDRKNFKFTVRNVCKYCYNVMYNPVPMSILDYCEDIINMGIKHYRIDLTIETSTQAKKVLDKYINRFVYDIEDNTDIGEVTKGHFYRGIM